MSNRLIIRADTILRDYLLNKWGAPYLIECAVCHKQYHHHDIQVGHIIPRRYYATRWVPKNMLPLCIGCNQENGDSEKLLLLVSEKDAIDLLQLKNDTSFRLSHSFLLDVINTYDTK